MAIKIPHLNFNADAFGHAFVARKAGRWLQQLFDGLGKARVVFIVKNNQDLLDLISPELRVHYKALGEGYKEILPKFTDDEVYAWIPPYWREIIESSDIAGRSWGMRQVAAIRKYALS